MKKISFYAIWFIITLASVLFFELTLKSCTPAENNEPVKDSIDTIKINTMEIKKYDEVNNIELDYRFPVVEIKDTTAKNFINDRINELVQEQLDRFAIDTLAGKKNTFNMDFIVYKNTDGKISILFDILGYPSGAAHHMNYFKALNYDLNKMQKILLSFLFKIDSDHLYEIAQNIRPRLKARENLKDGWVDEGTKPRVDNYRNYNFTDSSIVISFPPYQLNAYSEGSHVIEVLFKDLEGVKDNYK